MTVTVHRHYVLTVYLPPGLLPQFAPTAKGDERLLTVTIRHLLHHTAGWDQRLVGDPLLWRGIGKAMGTPEPAGRNAVIGYMMGQPLQFIPGRTQSPFMTFNL